MKTYRFSGIVLEGRNRTPVFHDGIYVNACSSEHAVRRIAAREDVANYEFVGEVGCLNKHWRCEAC
jgi:hypothetical protein